jgi:hypothetical protein
MVTRAKLVYAVLGGCLVVGGVLRLATLGDQSLGHDEAVTLGRVLQPGLSNTLTEVGHGERTPFLYYVLTWLWAKGFGVSTLGVRSLSALFGTATIVAAFGAGRAAASERTGVVAAALVAVDPFFVYYSQEARSYAALAFLMTLSLWAFACTLRRPTRRAVAAWAVLCAMALATHYFAVFVVAGEAAWLLAAHRGRRELRIALVPTVVVALALTPLLLEQLRRQGGSVEQASTVRQIPTALVQFLVGERLSLRGLYTITPLLGVAALALAVWLVILAWRWQLRKLAAVGTVGLFAMLAPFAIGALGVGFFNARNCIVALPALIILFAGCASHPSVRPRGTAVAAIAAAAGLVVSIAVLTKASLQRPDYRDAAAMLGPSWQGKRALVLSPGGDTPTLWYRSSHDPRAWPSAGMAVDEIDVIAANDATPAGPAPSGFAIIAARDAGTIRVTRLRASHPVVITTATLRSLEREDEATYLVEGRG